MIKDDYFKKLPKFKLVKFDTVIYTEEHTQYVRYVYSIDDSIGLLEIDLTIPEDADPVEEFCISIKNLYRGYYNYIIYHSKYKYQISIDRNDPKCYHLSRYKMW